MVILVNPSARGGTALGKWLSIEAQIRQRLGATARVVLTDGADATRQCMAAMLDEGRTEFVAAGGDGTVSLLVDCILKRAPPSLLPVVKVGALGLGSSNDFHKPFRKERFIDGVPCRIDFQATIPHDVGLLTLGPGGEVGSRCWIVNASIGITAEANLFFNTPDPVLRLLKRRIASGAIAYAALRTLALHRNRRMTLAVDDKPPFETLLTNVGVVKNPNFSGTLSYRSPYEPASGRFYVHLCERMSRPRTLFTLWRSSRRGFQGLPFTRSWHARRLQVRASRPFAVEFDGEVETARSASFSIKRGAIQLCT